MSVSYEGKSPSRLWYTWQKTKGIFATKQHMPVAKASGGTVASATGTVLVNQQIALVLTYLPLAIGGLGALGAYNAYKAVRPGNDKQNKISTQDRWMSAAKYAGAAALIAIFTPTAATWVTLGLVGATGYFGVKTYKNFKNAAGSMSVRNFIRDQESTWLENKKAGNLRQRIVKSIRAFGQGLKKSLLHTTKFGGIGAAIAGVAATAAGAAHFAGAAFATGATATTILGGIVTAGAVMGIGATAAVYTAAALAVAAIPVGIATAFIARNKLRDMAATPEGETKKPFYKGISAETLDISTPVKSNAPANDVAPKTPAFNETAAPVAEKKPAPIAKPAAKPSAEMTAEEKARKEAAEARKRNKRDQAGKKFG